MCYLLIRNILLTISFFGIAVYLIATHHEKYAVMLLPSILALWMHNSRALPKKKHPLHSSQSETKNELDPDSLTSPADRNT